MVEIGKSFLLFMACIALSACTSQTTMTDAQVKRMSQLYWACRGDGSDVPYNYDVDCLHAAQETAMKDIPNDR